MEIETFKSFCIGQNPDLKALKLFYIVSMKKLQILLFIFIFGKQAHAQIICIYCFDQNDSISQNVNNLILNGGFENTTCTSVADQYCPNSASYNCDILNWTCTGGVASTYACIVDTGFYSTLVEGTHLAYFGNSFCHACSPLTNDTICLTDSGCTVTGIPAGYPDNTGGGGNVGVNLEQTVNGLIIGNTYVLEFWTGGEWPATYPNRGLFAVDIGFGKTFLRNKPYHTPLISTRFIIEFNAVATSTTIKFTNWGHICSDCTELMLDDVRLYTLAELSPVVPPCAGATTTAMFTAPNNVCPGTCTDFTNLSTNATNFIWNFPGANPNVSTDQNPTNICYNTPGNYDVQLIASNAITSDTLSLPNYITVYPFPPPQGILQIGDTLFANAGSVSYLWYYNGNIISGATNYFYVATQSGNYNVVAIDENGCEVEAVINNVIAETKLAVGPEVSGQLAIFPNPVEDKFTIHNALPIAIGITMGTAFDISIYNVLGERVLIQESRSKIDEEIIDVSKLGSGLYYIEVKSGEKIFRSKFVKSTY